MLQLDSEIWAGFASDEPVMSKKVYARISLRNGIWNLE